MSDCKHPLQGIYCDEKSVARFRKNEIVQYLLDAGPFDINQLALMPFDDEDRTQFAQLIGYSVSGFGDLPYVSKEVVDKADAEAEVLRGAE